MVTMDYFTIDPEKLFNTTFFDQLTEERFEFYWVIRGLQYILVFVFTLIAILGFSIYLWYLNSQLTNSLLSNLYGFMALGGICLCAQKVLNFILIEYFELDHPMLCYANLIRNLIVTFTLLTMGIISAATALRHFNSSKYLDYSENWSNIKCGLIILALSVVAIIWTLKLCGGCENVCIMKERQFFFLITIPGSLLVIILLTTDDLLDLCQFLKRIRSLFFGNVSTPVITISPVSEVSKKVLILEKLL